MNLLTLLLSMFLVTPIQAGGQTRAPGPAQAPATAPASATAPVPATTPAPAVSSTPQSGYKIGPEDEINLVVVGEEQFTHTFLVQADGAISLPLVGTIMAQGLTAIELTERITGALQDWLRNPQVRVQVSKYGSQSVTVTGEVKDPGRIPMTGPMTLLGAVVAAGSPTSNAGSQVKITRKKSATETETLSVNLTDLMGGKPGADRPLVGDDIINVPAAEKFSVRGRVRTTGQQIWEPGLTVNLAIIKAGGMDDRGSDRNIKITRLEKGKTLTFDAKLTDMVMPGDIVDVGQRLF